VWGFYIIVATSVRTRPDAVRLIYASVLGLGLVAFLAFIEKYNGFNFVDHIAPGYSAQNGRMITVTFQHRILLGTGMAMGLPLAFLMLTQSNSPGRKRLLWIIVLLLCGAAYFAHSRGPWLGAAMAGCVLYLLGSPRMRSRLIWIPILAAAVLLARPGVYETLMDSAKATGDADSYKGKTFMYRLELWRIAWVRVKESPLRLLVGYGPGCGEEQAIEWNLSYSGRKREISSWDNHYAYDLLQSGLLGLFARLFLYLAVFRAMFQVYKRGDEQDREIFAALLASACVLLFMMSNVLIFSKQLNFLFWTLAAVCSSFMLSERVSQAENSPVEVEVSDGFSDQAAPGLGFGEQTR
jgi:O-antigen ligase